MTHSRLKFYLNILQPTPHLVVPMSKSNKNSGAQNRNGKAQDKELAIGKDSLLQFMKEKESGDENEETTRRTIMQESISLVYNKDSIVTGRHNGNSITN